MRILLIGEFSGLHLNLKEGLIALGHEVTLAAYSDGYKKVPGADISFDVHRTGIIGRIEGIISPLFNIKLLFGYDVVQFISFKVFNPRFGINSHLMRAIIKNNDKAFLVGAGCDSFLLKYGKTKLKYGWFNDNLQYDIKKSNHEFESDSWLNWNNELVGIIDGYIPLAHEYKVGYENSIKLRPGIPMPINTNDIIFNASIKNDNLLSIIHGLSRYGFKGTRFVESAFKTLKAKYNHRASFDIFGNLPFKEYLQLINDSDVMVDQLWSHSTGMNALYGLAKGKIVISGAEKESLEFLNVQKSPIINVFPSEDSLIEKIEMILSWDKTLIQEKKLEGRKFVESTHNHIVVANCFVNEWNN